MPERAAILDGDDAGAWIPAERCPVLVHRLFRVVRTVARSPASEAALALDLGTRFLVSVS